MTGKLGLLHPQLALRPFQAHDPAGVVVDAAGKGAGLVLELHRHRGNGGIIQQLVDPINRSDRFSEVETRADAGKIEPQFQIAIRGADGLVGIAIAIRPSTRQIG